MEIRILTLQQNIERKILKKLIGLYLGEDQ